MSEERTSLERNVVIAIGVSWGWLFHERNSVPHLAWLIPCLFAVLGLTRVYGITKFYRAASAYIKTIENVFFSPDSPVGWEHFTPNKHWTRTSAAAFWGILISATLLVATYEMKAKQEPIVPTARSDTPKPSSNPQNPR